MKSILFIVLMGVASLFNSCDEGKKENKSDLQIQGEETGGMGTGPGPGVNVPLDTAKDITPDTLIIN